MVTEEQESSMGLASESIPVPQQMHNSLQRPCEEMLNQEGNVSRGKPRLRKKALHALILKQMEFYFSDANLSKDRFLGNLIKSDPYVDLNVFLHFNKIRVLTEDVNRVAKALKNSTILSLSEDGTKVCRTTPINPRDNSEACTVYVQGLPPDANHDWLSNLFSQYGAIAYVSIPRYKSNRKIKGFAFVEFDKVEGADKCLEAFKEKNCTLPSHTGPHDLLSITTFTEDEPSSELMSIAELAEHTSNEIITARKRNAEDSNEIPEDKQSTIAKKARLDESEQDNDAAQESNESSEEPEKVSQVEEKLGHVETPKESEDKKTKKNKKRKRKRRSRSEKIDVADLGLQIMAKRDWKQLRNKYLQLQRNKMKQLKQHLHKARWSQWGGNYDRKEKMDTEQIEKRDISIKEKDESSSPKFSFIPGVIVKMLLDEPCSNPKSFKLELRSEPAVKYIDVYEGSSEAFVRCDNAEAAKSFTDKHSEKRNLRILEGHEEKTYWDKILQDREEKLSKKDRVKQRGRDKLLKKAEKELGKHIKFDEV